MQASEMATRATFGPYSFQGRDLRRRCRQRRGAVAVEFALTAGLLFLIVFTAVEFMRVNTIINSTENAAYEGARAGVVPGATAADAIAAAQSMVNTIGVRNATVVVAPDTLQSDTPEITVTIQVPLDSNSFIAPRYFLGKTLTKACTLSRETSNAGS